MKKLLIIGIAALAALAMVTCDGAPVDVVDNTDGGISLSVGGTGARALTGKIAKDGSDYFEATFIKALAGGGTDVIRTSWDYAHRGRIELEPGAYKVILFAGRDIDKTLLGVGRASAVLPAGSGTVTIASLDVTVSTTTTQINFTVYPLMNDINQTATSTFVVDGGPSAAPYAVMNDSLGNAVPIFMINKDDTTDLSWSFGIGGVPGNTADLIETFDGYMMVPSAPDPAVFNIGVSGERSLEVPIKLDDLVYSPPPNAGALLSTATTPGTFSMEATAPDADGIVKIALEIPIVAVNENKEPTIWYIRGGLNNALLDAGINPTQGPGVLGGSIILGFGTLTSFPKIILNPGY